MSDGTKHPLARAQEIAAGVLNDLTPWCERIEIAGSVRRKKPEVGDVEIVAIPKIVQGKDLFGGPGSAVNLLEEQARTYVLGKNGPKQKQLILASCKVDLFITTPKQWGVIYTIRTGSAEFVHWLVTPRRYGGALPSNMRVSEGRLMNMLGPLDTPEEADVFRLVGLDWIAPEDRTGPMPKMLKRHGGA